MASDKVGKIVDEVSALSVLELSELVSQLQDKLGVSAMPTMAAAPVVAAADAPKEEAGGGTVILTSPGDNKIAVIKALREINPNLGLQEAKAMTEQLPAEVMKDGKAEDAKAASEKLTAAGATVEVK